MKNLLKQRWSSSALLHIASLIFLILIIYSNTLNAPFQWDEGEYLGGNQIVKDFRFFLMPSEAQGFKYYNFLILRYVGYLTFALQYQMHGFSVLGYHIVNIAIHMANAILVYFFILLTFKTPLMERSSLKGQAPSVAFFSSMLFAAHPLQTMAVTYVFQRFASLAALFYLIALTAYIQSRLAEERRKSIIFYSIALVSSVLAMKTKEIAFTLPIMIALYEVLFFRGTLKRRMLFLAPILLTLSIIPLTLVGLKGSQPLPGSYSAVVLSRGEYLLTQFRVIVTYLRLLFFPANQNIDYDYPVSLSFFDPQVMLSAMFLAMLFCLGWYLIQAKGKDEAQKVLLSPNPRVAGFGILWFFIALSVESSIIPLDRIIDEYRVYLPSIGVSISVVTGVFLLKESIRSLRARKAILVMLILAGGILSCATYLRNEVWGDSIRLWEDTAEKSPAKKSVHINLGNAYKNLNMPNKAIDQYLIALKLKPDCAEAHNNLGVIYMARNMPDEAVKEYLIAINLKLDYAEAHSNLGNLYLTRNMPDEAVKEYLIAIKIRPDLAEVHFNLGSLYYKMGQMEKAQRELRTGLQMKPGDRQAKELLEAISR